jgi:hypothetical protein
MGESVRAKNSTRSSIPACLATFAAMSKQSSACTAAWAPDWHHVGAAHVGLGDVCHLHVHMIVPGGGISLDGSK